MALWFGPIQDLNAMQSFKIHCKIVEDASGFSVGCPQFPVLGRGQYVSILGLATKGGLLFDFNQFLASENFSHFQPALQSLLAECGKLKKRIFGRLLLLETLQLQLGLH